MSKLRIENIKATLFEAGVKHDNIAAVGYGSKQGKGACVKTHTVSADAYKKRFARTSTVHLSATPSESME